MVKESDLLIDPSVSEFANENTVFDCTYKFGYKHEKISIADQAAKVQELFPGIGKLEKNIIWKKLPDCAEGWFAVPYWEAIGNDYETAMEKLFSVIKEKMNFSNLLNGMMESSNLRKNEQSAAALSLIAKKQDSDIIIFPIQTGIRFRGKSVRLSKDLFLINEFGIGSFEAGCILLTHPMRFSSYLDLWIDCGGDEFSKGGNNFFHIPHYSVHLEGGILKVKFDFHACSVANPRAGTASGFNPEFLV